MGKPLQKKVFIPNTTACRISIAGNRVVRIEFMSAETKDYLLSVSVHGDVHISRIRYGGHALLYSELWEGRFLFGYSFVQSPLASTLTSSNPLAGSLPLQTNSSAVINSGGFATRSPGDQGPLRLPGAASLPGGFATQSPGDMVAKAVKVGDEIDNPGWFHWVSRMYASGDLVYLLHSDRGVNTFKSDLCCYHLTQPNPTDDVRLRLIWSMEIPRVYNAAVYVEPRREYLYLKLSFGTKVLRLSARAPLLV